MKIAISIILIVLGFFILAFWYVAAHGALHFRPGRGEDWAFAGVIFVCFAVPVVFLCHFLWRRFRREEG